MSDLTLSTLGVIRTKVRRLTRNPSPSQLTDADIDAYVNTFVLYDFPEHLRLFSLRRTFSFYTKPYVDLYSTVTAPTTDPMYNFKNRFTSVHKQIAIAGYPIMLSESREQFYGIYPKTASIAQIGQGNGVTVNFNGTLAKVPVLRGSVLFSAVDVNNGGLSVVDIPLPLSSLGQLVVPDSNVVIGGIDYVSGLYSFTFPLAPDVGTTVYSQTVPVTVSRPQAILYYNDEFIVRPVPDQPYKVEMEVYVRPTELLATAQTPDISEWWQYIAYGAAKKVFEDRQDMESVQMIMPEFRTQQSLVLRRTIMNMSNERTSTIYTEQVDMSSGLSGWGGNNV
jgi:hypothetical protein